MTIMIVEGIENLRIETGALIFKSIIYVIILTHTNKYRFTENATLLDVSHLF